MVGDGEVRAGEVVDGDTSGADQVEDVPTVMDGETDVLSDIKELNMSRNSVGILQSVESMWMLKPPRSRMEREMEQSWVRNSDRPKGKAGLSLGEW